MRVVDVGCGTGITTIEIFKKIKNTGKIIGIDHSKEMLNIAKKKIQEKNIVFINSPAEEMDKLIEEKVDLIICNFAFWQMNTDMTLNTIVKILKNNGKFVFNIPFNLSPRTNIKISSLETTMHKIASVKLKTKNDEMKSRIFSMMEKISENKRFKIISDEIFELDRTLDDIYNFFKIPIMTKSILPELSYKERMKILDSAYTECEKNEKGAKFRFEWPCYVLQKIK